MKKLLAGALLAMVVSCTGCGANTPSQQSAEVQEEKQEEAATPYALVSESMELPSLKGAGVPVYDKLTRRERMEKGLPAGLPKLDPKDSGKVAYLTFDDGPDDRNTMAVLDILKEEKVPATFYVVGKRAESYPDTVKRMAEEGHAVGNHSYDHDYGRLYASPQAFLAEMEQTDEIFMRILGMRPLILRAPGGVVGHFNDSYWEALREAGYVEHDWNVSSADAAPGHPVAQDFIDNINGQTENVSESHAAIILMHCSEGHEETVKALPEIIRLLREKGYQFGVVTPMTPQPW